MTRAQARTLSINAVRMLALDAVEQAKSGHAGMPMGCAPLGCLLFTEIMRHNPFQPRWFNRDRFVLSAGHGSMFSYALLHLCGYAVSMDDLRRFRQWDSKTPGHPEYHHTPGIEMTTGPLGQGISTAVGMALAEKKLAAEFNRPGYTVVDHHTYVIASDGDLMEGISGEASSLAGHLKLGKLIVFYDDNEISIDGSIHIAFTEDRQKRYEAYGWQTLKVGNGEDVNAIKRAILKAQADPRPTLISVKTVIGFGSPRAGTHKAHSDAMGAEAVAETRKNLNWPHPPFEVPKMVYLYYRQARSRGEAAYADWNEQMMLYAQAHPELAAELKRRIAGDLPQDWKSALPKFTAGEKLATRAASGKVLEGLVPRVPELIGGSADLTPSNNTRTPDMTDFTPENPSGRYIRYGVREHAMGAAMNGITLHGGLHPYSGTFFVFSDYMRPAIRMAAIMGIPTTFVFTHDSVGVGEDGPTHQPIEHLASLRAMPNLWVIRPADAGETIYAWQMALERKDGPVLLALTRQALPVLAGANDQALKGGYVISDAEGARAVIVATGSEVSLALESQVALAKEGIAVRVVSLPCWEVFESQPAEYRAAVLPKHLPTVSVEAGATLGWERYAVRMIGVDRFGASAPFADVYKNLGFTVERVMGEVKDLLKG